MQDYLLVNIHPTLLGGVLSSKTHVRVYYHPRVAIAAERGYEDLRAISTSACAANPAAVRKGP